MYPAQTKHPLSKAKIWKERLKAKLSQRATSGELRKLSALSNRPLVDFCSNDYLGLARCQALQAATIKRWSATKTQNGSTGSRLLTGQTVMAKALEAELARFFGAEAALLFPSGYTAMLALLAVVPQRHDLVLYDADSHACTKEGLRLGVARYFSFAHNDLKALKTRLQKHAASNKNASCFVLSEGLFSMRGTQAPLVELVALCAHYEATLILDEAHSTGIFGARGEGLAHAHKLTKAVAIRVHTFGKAWGLQGACVLGPRVLIDYLINFARPFIYSTASMPVQLHALTEVLERFQTGMTPQKQLWDNIQHFQTCIKTESLPAGVCAPQAGPIQAIHLGGGPLVCKAAEAALQTKGFDVRSILAPTVPLGHECLRICLHAFNSKDEIKALIKQLASICKKHTHVPRP